MRNFICPPEHSNADVPKCIHSPKLSASPGKPTCTLNSTHKNMSSFSQLCPSPFQTTLFQYASASKGNPRGPHLQSQKPGSHWTALLTYPHSQQSFRTFYSFYLQNFSNPSHTFHKLQLFYSLSGFHNLDSRSNFLVSPSSSLQSSTAYGGGVVMNLKRSIYWGAWVA